MKDIIGWLERHLARWVPDPRETRLGDGKTRRWADYLVFPALFARGEGWSAPLHNGSVGIFYLTPRSCLYFVAFPALGSCWSDRDSR